MTTEMNKTIFSYSAFNRAWNKIKAKRAQFGIDNVTIEQFQSGFKNNVDELILSVNNGEYMPEPYKLIFIEKKTGEYRPISLLSLKDKLLQSVIEIYCSNNLNAIFSDSSYAYRANKGHVKAIKRVRDYIMRKHTWFAHLDIDNFFDSIDRKLLSEKLNKLITNETVLRLLKMWIEVGVIFRGKYKTNPKGIAQGGVISPFLSNIYLNDFDKLLEEKQFNFVRYSDNILLIAKTKENLEQAINFSRQYLRNELKLGLNKKDHYIKNYDAGIEFLGIHFENGKLTMSDDKFLSKQEKIKKIIHNTPLEKIPEKFTPMLEGIKRYYLYFDTEEQMIELSEFLIDKLTRKAIANGISRRELSKIIFSLNLSSIAPPKKNNYFVQTAASIYGKEKEFSEKTDKLKRKLEIKSRKYVKIWYEFLDLIISTPYSSIGKQKNSIVVRNKGKILNEIIANKINNIIIAAKGVTISSNAVELASNSKIKIHYLDTLGRPYAVVIPGYAPINKAATEQLKSLNQIKAQKIIKTIITAKIKNQSSLLKYFYKSRQNLVPKEVWQNEMNLMKEILEKIKQTPFEEELDIFRNKILGYEGSFGASYWNLFTYFVPDFYGFTKREHQGAQNPVNILLNYGYGVLYGRMLTSATITGLNPQIGFLHKPQKNKPALIFDLIEPFRAPVVDRTVLAMLSKMKKITITPKNFSDTIKRKFLSKILERLHADFYYRNKQVNFDKLILEEANEIKKYLLDEIKTLKIFTSKW